MDGGFKLRKSHYNKKHCSPKKSLPYSCLTHTMLLKIVKAINKIKGITINYHNISDKKLYRKICNVIQNNFKCKTEACWLNIRKIMSNLSKKDAEAFRKYFRPHMPDDIVDDYTEWISNFDIEAVLKQYSEDIDDFYFYGAVPIDFHKCSVSNLCKINLKNHINNGIKKIGIVFNTDNSNEPGKHWIAMYVDIVGNNLRSKSVNQPGIYYFDSFADEKPSEINDLINKLKNQGKSNNIEFIDTYNRRSLQNNTFSCGFYCIHFLENMINGKPFHKYINSGVNDKKMIEYRSHCFLNPKEIKY